MFSCGKYSCIFYKKSWQQSDFTFIKNFLIFAHSIPWDFEGCKKQENLKNSDTVFSRRISNMVPFDHWDVDNKSEQNDTTGPNILLKALLRLLFFDPSTETVVYRRKIPRDLKGFAKLNKPSQSHLIAMTFDPEVEGVTIYYNKSCN